MKAYSKKNNYSFPKIFFFVKVEMKFKHYFFKRVCNILYNMVGKIDINRSVKLLNYQGLCTNKYNFLLIGDLK